MSDAESNSPSSDLNNLRSLPLKESLEKIKQLRSEHKRKLMNTEQMFKDTNYEDQENEVNDQPIGQRKTRFSFGYRYQKKRKKKGDLPDNITRSMGFFPTTFSIRRKNAPKRVATTFGTARKSMSSFRKVKSNQNFRKKKKPSKGLLEGSNVSHLRNLHSKIIKKEKNDFKNDSELNLSSSRKKIMKDIIGDEDIEENNLKERDGNEDKKKLMDDDIKVICKKVLSSLNKKQKENDESLESFIKSLSKFDMSQFSKAEKLKKKRMREIMSPSLEISIWKDIKKRYKKKRKKKPSTVPTPFSFESRESNKKASRVKGMKSWLLQKDYKDQNLFKKGENTSSKFLKSSLKKEKKKVKKGGKKFKNLIPKKQIPDFSDLTSDLTNESEIISIPQKFKRTKKRKKKVESTTDAEITCRHPPFIKTTLYAPSWYSSVLQQNKEIPDDPPVSLELEFIYGSSRKGVRGKTLFVTKHNKIVYPAAACVVVYDASTHTQKIFQKHVDDVKCITMHPGKEIIASGEAGKDDMVYIWNSDSMELLSSLKTFKRFRGGGVLGLSFNASGNKLAVMGGSELDSQLLLYKWSTEEIRNSIDCSRKVTFAMEFNPINRKSVVVCSKDEIKFFHVKAGKWTQNRGVISSKGGKLQKFYCVDFDGQGRSYVGTRDGSIYVFEENKLVHHKKVHSKSVCVIKMMEDRNEGFMTGSKDGKVKFFKFDKRNFFIEERDPIDVGFGVVEFVRYDNGKKMLIWGRNGSFKRLDLESGKSETIMNSHSGLSVRNELWGIDSVSNSDLFYSCGDDGKVFLWDSESRKCVWCFYDRKKKLRSIAVSPVNKKDVCVGTFDGFVLVIDTESITSKSKKVLSCGIEEIAAMMFSPDGKYLAVGSHDNFIYLFDVENEYELKRIIKGHTSFVKNLDWSKNSKYIRTTSGDYELLYWKSPSGRRVVDHSDMKDVVWASQNCTLGFCVKGMWQKGRNKTRLDGTDINGCCVDFKRNLLVSVDDFGLVNVYKYPTLSNNPKRKQYIGHCSHVTSVRKFNTHTYVNNYSLFWLIH